MPSIARSRSSTRDGANPNPQLPNATEVTPCHPDSVQVDKAGCHDTACSVQNPLGGLPFQAADLGDLAVLDRDVADIAGRPRPINDRAAFDDNVVVRHLGDSFKNRHSRPVAHNVLSRQGAAQLNSIATTPVGSKP